MWNFGIRRKFNNSFVDGDVDVTTHEGFLQIIAEVRAEELWGQGLSNQMVIFGYLLPLNKERNMLE